jgi:AcrR family transcriptional regulator
MSPRPYKLGRRRASADETRTRIVDAARALLADESQLTPFTIDAIAERAGVARMTVYYQFGSKRGVLEALFDRLANRGLMPHLAPIFHEPDPRRALDGLISAFAAFWNDDRVVLRRARALAALDHEFAASVRGRDDLRRGHLRSIVERLQAGKRQKPTAPIKPAIDTLHMLTSFETFDALLREGRSIDEAIGLVRQLAASLID